MKWILRIATVASMMWSGGLWAQGGQDVVAKLGIDRGGLTIGGEYVIRDTQAEGFAGYFSMHSKDEDKGAPGLTAIGGAFRLAQTFGPYELFLSPGLGVVSYDFAGEDDLLIGPKVSYGLHAELDPNLALGFENQKLYSWMGEVKGQLADTFLLTVKFGL